MCVWLAASLAIHGVAFGGVVLVAIHGAPGPDGGVAAAGGGMRASLVDASPGAGRGAPEVARLRTQGQPANAGAEDPVAARTQSPPRRAKRSEPSRDSLLREPAVAADAPGGESERASRLPEEPNQTERSIEIARVVNPPARAPARPAPAPASRVREHALSSPSPGCVSSGPRGGGGAAGPRGSTAGYRAGPLDQPARPAAPIRPHYPPLARQRGEEGDVIVQVWVGSEGEADRVAVARSGGAEFDRAAVSAVRRAHFHPALRDGREVPSQVALQIHFRLDQ